MFLSWHAVQRWQRSFCGAELGVGTYVKTLSRGGVPVLHSVVDRAGYGTSMRIMHLERLSILQAGGCRARNWRGSKVLAKQPRGDSRADASRAADFEAAGRQLASCSAGKRTVARFAR